MQQESVLMFFIIYRKDKPGHLQVRLDNHQKHLEFIGPYKDKVMVGGPTLGFNPEKGEEEMTGSFVILDAESWEAAEDFVKNDPFTKAGLFSTTIIERWKHGKHTETAST
jgi:uncharacterized protein